MRPVALTDFTPFVKPEPACCKMDTLKVMVGHSFMSGLVYDCENANVPQILFL